MGLGPGALLQVPVLLRRAKMEKESWQGLYNLLSSRAILGPLAEEFRTLKLTYDKDGKIRRGPFTVLNFETLWVWAGEEKTRLCYVWNELYFQKYRIISRNCFNCWKVVCKCDSIKDLFMVRNLQIELNATDPDNYVGKCGVEGRRHCTWGGRYAAFWYTPLTKNSTLYESREIGRKVEEEVKKINPDLKVILKRACTEMEMSAGPSDRWTYQQEGHKVEDELDELIDIGPDIVSQTQKMKDLMMKSWINHAFISGDKTVVDFVVNYPNDFGVQPAVDYLNSNPKILSNNVKRGKIGEYTTDRNNEARSDKPSLFLV